MSFDGLSFAVQANIALILILLTLAGARLVTWSLEHRLRRELPIEKLPTHEGEYIRLLGLIATFAVAADGIGAFGTLFGTEDREGLRAIIGVIRGIGLVALTILLMWDIYRIGRLRERV